eukprot:Hpha_TRINITY_DN13816_c1_g1::TRINITY_DN13816_c1_g1_i2::g.69702::m.69702
MSGGVFPLFVKKDGGDPVAIEAPINGTVGDLMALANIQPGESLHFDERDLTTDRDVLLADTGISAEVVLICQSMTKRFLGYFSWHQDQSVPLEEQDRLMDQAAAECFGPGARAARGSDYTEKRIHGLPEINNAKGQDPSGKLCDGYVAFAGEEANVADTAHPGKRWVQPGNSFAGGTYSGGHAYTSNNRTGIAVS